MIAPHFIVEDISVASIAADQERLRDDEPESEAVALAQGCRQRLLSAGTTPGSIPNFGHWDISEYLAYIRVPVAILQGADDQYGTMRQVEIAQEECYCPVDVTVIPGAGHSPHREAPEATLDTISEFARRDFIRAMTARRGAPPVTLGLKQLVWRCRDEHPFVHRRQSSAAAMGLCPRRCRGSRCRSRYPVRRPWRWCHPGSVTSFRRGIRRCATGFALNDHGFFWESQQILEAVWAAAPQGGRERILLRACIQIAAANLQAADAEASRRGAAARRGAGRTRDAQPAQGGRRRRRVCRLLSDRRAVGAAEGQTGAAAALPRPIGWSSAPSAGHETKCMFLRFRLDLLQKHALLCI